MLSWQQRMLFPKGAYWVLWILLGPLDIIKTIINWSMLKCNKKQWDFAPKRYSDPAMTAKCLGLPNYVMLHKNMQVSWASFPPQLTIQVQCAALFLEAEPQRLHF